MRKALTWLSLLALTTGCTASDSRPTAKAPLPSASQATADAGSPRPVPPEATAPTPAGASAFAAYYLQVVSDAFATGQTAFARTLTEPSCGTCLDILALADRQPRGARLQGGEYRVLSAATPGLSGSQALVDLTYSRPPSTLLGRDGRVLATEAAVPSTLAQMQLNRVRGRWLVEGFRVLSA